WTDMQSTDKKANGKVWDMYSDNPGGTPPYEFTFGTDQDVGTGGSTEGEFYNREHSFPKSWFDDGSPMYTDLFHLYPTDKLVNNKRGNYPYGEIDNASWTSLNGSKVGSCSYPGYSGTVFEPIDAYKGDFARTYFYMATRYYGDDGDWPGSDMTNGAQMKPWALAMMREWDKNDPVSEKELNRNNAVYTIQKNRNPFIDYPWFSGLIWGNLAPAPTNLRLENESTCSPKLVWDDVSDNETGFLIYNHDSLFADVSADSASCLLSGFYSGDTLILYVTSQTAEGETPSKSLEIIIPDSCSNPNAISQENISIPAAFILHQNFPNPFNASTIFQFENLIKQELSLIIYDSNGKVVFEKYFADLAPGMHQFQWNPKELTSGIYFYQFTAGKIHCSGKSLLIK
ncbi:MAG: endonuclease, partial [Candidatus Marinimicrobia bacterium]|nr:endonuclease [Candidatus Neomarinimicrobiota bacterium]